MAGNNGTVIFVVDWWEKLAGASLALTAMLHLCKASGSSLVEPFVHSSKFRPFLQPESLPLDAYYELEPIRAAVHLVTYARWEAHAAATPQRQRTAVLLVWSDFPKEWQRRQRALARRSPCGHTLLQKPTRVLGAALWRGCRREAAVVLFCLPRNCRRQRTWPCRSASVRSHRRRDCRAALRRACGAAAVSCTTGGSGPPVAGR